MGNISPIFGSGWNALCLQQYGNKANKSTDYKEASFDLPVHHREKRPKVPQQPVLAEVQRRSPGLLVGLRRQQVQARDHLRQLAVDDQVAPALADLGPAAAAGNPAARSSIDQLERDLDVARLFSAFTSFLGRVSKTRRIASPMPPAAKAGAALRAAACRRRRKKSRASSSRAGAPVARARWRLRGR